MSSRSAAILLQIAALLPYHVSGWVVSGWVALSIQLPPQVVSHFQCYPLAVMSRLLSNPGKPLLKAHRNYSECYVSLTGRIISVSEILTWHVGKMLRWLGSVLVYCNIVFQD
jgi:hypothetical protein